MDATMRFTNTKVKIYFVKVLKKFAASVKIL